MATIGKVSAVFTASTSGLRSGVNQAASSMSALERAAKSTANGMRALVALQGVQFFGNIASQVGGYVRSLVDMGRVQAEAIDGQSKLAARLGMTYKELSGLSLAGDLAGVSMESIAGAITKADVAFVRAAEGSKQAAAALAGVGLSVQDLNGLSASDRFSSIAEAISKIPNEAQRAEAAVQLFGRAGAQLLPLFAGGAGAIKEATAQAERFGLALTNAQARDVEAMNDSFTLVQKSIAGIIQQVTARLAPTITKVAETFTDFIGAAGGANIGQQIAGGILEGARVLARLIDSMQVRIPDAFRAAAQVADNIAAAFDVANRVFAGFGVFFNTFEILGNLVGGILSGATSGILSAVAKLAEYTGFSESAEELRASADAWGETMDQYNKAIEKNAGDLAANVSTVIASDTGKRAGEAAAGPIEAALNALIERAKANASAIDQAERKQIEINSSVNMDPVRKAVEGIDSRSAEGLKTMFRIMRGDDGADIQERQLRVQEGILDTLQDQDGLGDLEVVDLAPAAGA